MAASLAGGIDASVVGPVAGTWVDTAMLVVGVSVTAGVPSSVGAPPTGPLQPPTNTNTRTSSLAFIRPSSSSSLSTLRHRTEFHPTDPVSEIIGRRLRSPSSRTRASLSVSGRGDSPNAGPGRRSMEQGQAQSADETIHLVVQARPSEGSQGPTDRRCVIAPGDQNGPIERSGSRTRVGFPGSDRPSRWIPRNGDPSGRSGALIPRF